MKTRVMRRVYAIWLAKQVVNPFSIKVLGLALMLAKVREYASVKHVLRNSPSFMNPLDTVSFFGNALSRTELVTDLLVLGMVVVVVLLFRDTMKRFSLAAEYMARSSVTF